MTTREIYIHKHKKEKRNILVVQIFTVLFFLFIWEILTIFKIVDPFIFSSPTRIFKTFMQLAQGEIYIHILTTVVETVIGFLLGITLGFFIAVALWFSPFAAAVAAPFLVVLNSLPKIALGPVIIVWAGAGMPAIIVMAVAISLIVTVLELSGGFQGTDKNLITTVKSFGANQCQIFYKLVLPYNIPVLFQSLKVNIGLSLVGVIAGEFLVSKAGLGYLIVYAGQVFKMDLVMMSVIILSIIAFFMYKLIAITQQLVEKKFNHNN